MTEKQQPSAQYPDMSASHGTPTVFTLKEQWVLNTINQRVTAAESLDATMDFVFEAVKTISECDRIGLSFLEEDNARVVCHWARADYEPILLGKGYSEDLRGSSLEQVLKKGRPRVIADLEQYLREHLESRSTQIIVREGVRSSMTCPLVVEGRPVGFLFRSSRRTNAFDDHQVSLHLAVAERLSQAVEKAWRIEQLTAANAAYFETLGFVSHELRSPLSSLVMDAEMLAGGYLGELPPQQREKVERMIFKAQYLLGLIEEYINLAHVESGQLELKLEEDIDLIAEIVEPSIALVQTPLDEKHMKLTQDLPGKPLRITCDPSLLKIVLVNLLSNAVKYGHDKGEVRLGITSGENGVNVSVWNQGPGFPQSERLKLFRKFSRLNTPELLKRKGSGIGLYTTWRIVQAHGGRINARSEPGQWAEFSFNLPQSPT